jgi:hypothetical protein
LATLERLKQIEATALGLQKQLDDLLTLPERIKKDTSSAQVLVKPNAALGLDSPILAVKNDLATAKANLAAIKKERADLEAYAEITKLEKLEKDIEKARNKIQGVPFTDQLQKIRDEISAYREPLLQEQSKLVDWYAKDQQYVVNALDVTKTQEAIARLQEINKKIKAAEKNFGSNDSALKLENTRKANEIDALEREIKGLERQVAKTTVEISEKIKTLLEKSSKNEFENNISKAEQEIRALEAKYRQALKTAPQRIELHNKLRDDLQTRIDGLLADKAKIEHAIAKQAWSQMAAKLEAARTASEKTRIQNEAAKVKRLADAQAEATQRIIDQQTNRKKQIEGQRKLEAAEIQSSSSSTIKRTTVESQYKTQDLVELNKIKALEKKREAEINRLTKIADEIEAVKNRLDTEKDKVKIAALEKTFAEKNKNYEAVRDRISDLDRDIRLINPTRTLYVEKTTTGRDTRIDDLRADAAARRIQELKDDAAKRNEQIQKRPEEIKALLDALAEVPRGEKPEQKLVREKNIEKLTAEKELWDALGGESLENVLKRMDVELSKELKKKNPDFDKTAELQKKIKEWPRLYAQAATPVKNKVLQAEAQARANLKELETQTANVVGRISNVKRSRDAATKPEMKEKFEQQLRPLDLKLKDLEARTEITKQELADLKLQGSGVESALKYLGDRAGRTQTVKVKEVLTDAQKERIALNKKAARQDNANLNDYLATQDKGLYATIDINLKGKVVKLRAIDDTGGVKVNAEAATTAAAALDKAAPKDVKVTSVGDYSELPARAKKLLAEAGIEEGSPREAMVRGFVAPDGEVFIVRNNHSSVKELERTYAHEIIGHAGVDRLLGHEGVRELAKRIEAQGGAMELAKKLGVEKEVAGAINDYTMSIQKLSDAKAPTEQIKKAIEDMES